MASIHLSTDAPASEIKTPPTIPEEAAPRGLSHIGDHVPFIMLMASLPSMPRWQLARIANRAIECLDLTEADPEAEADPFNEGEPAFDAKSRAMVSGHYRHDPDHDAEAASWLERADQSAEPYGNLTPGHFQNGEDAEDDDPAEDEHDAENEEGEAAGFHGIDQREIRHWGGEWRAE